MIIGDDNACHRLHLTQLLFYLVSSVENGQNQVERMANPSKSLKKSGPPTERRRMYLRLRVLQRLGLVGPILRLQRRIDGK